MTHLSALSKTSAFALAIVTGLLFVPVLCAQVDQPGIIMEEEQNDVREFYNQADEVIATGNFYMLQGSTVTLRNETGQLVEHNINKFSEEEQDNFRALERERRKIERANEETKEILDAMDVSSDQSIISSCNKLKRLGPLAIEARMRVYDLLSRDEPAVKRAVIVCWLHTCERSEQQLSSIIHCVNINRDGVGEWAHDHPELFLDAVASMGQFGYRYIHYVACTGYLTVEGTQLPADVEPVIFEVSHSELNENREAACKSLGEFEGEPVVLEALLELLNVVDQPVNGVRDDKSLVAILRSIGSLKVVDQSAVDALERHKAEFEDVCTRSLDRLAREAERQQGG
ncbi:MAG: hypothetical protein AAF456_05425 [Planctomycetota bacterium]